MSDIQIFWDPEGVTLDSLGDKQFIRATDGDTPFISVSIRMLSIDAPEVHYPGTTKPSKQNDNFKQLALWIEQGKAPIFDDLAAYLHPRLNTGMAGSLQEKQGQQSAAIFNEMLERQLTKPNGKKRSLFVRTSDVPFDSYGRLLAYISPAYNRAEQEKLSKWERASFNLLLVRAGWVAPFIIYPSLPRYSDLLMFHQAAKEAYVGGRGIWAEPLTLTGYEFRMAVKLFSITQKLVKGDAVPDSERYSWVTRFCADMTTKEIFFPQDYIKISPYNRLFIWPADVKDAVATLSLNPGKR